MYVYWWCSRVWGKRLFWRTSRYLSLFCGIYMFDGKVKIDASRWRLVLYVIAIDVWYVRGLGLGRKWNNETYGKETTISDVTTCNEIVGIKNLLKHKINKIAIYWWRQCRSNTGNDDSFTIRTTTSTNLPETIMILSNNGSKQLKQINSNKPPKWPNIDKKRACW